MRQKLLVDGGWWMGRFHELTFLLKVSTFSSNLRRPRPTRTWQVLGRQGPWGRYPTCQFGGRYTSRCRGGRELISGTSTPTLPSRKVAEVAGDLHFLSEGHLFIVVTSSVYFSRGAFFFFLSICIWLSTASTFVSLFLVPC